jgi:hypothetical protein
MWSDEELLEELRSWLDRALSSSGGAYERVRRSNAAMPTLSTICRRFGSWQQALEEAGHTRERRVLRRYTNDELLNAVRTWIDSGGDGRATSYSRDAKRAELPSYNTVFLRFGSWRAALRAIGLEARNRRWSSDEALDAVAQWIVQASDTTFGAYARAAMGNPDLPSPATVTARLGSWPEVANLATRQGQRSGEVGSG